MFGKRRNGKVENPQSGGEESIREVPDVRADEYATTHLPDEIHREEFIPDAEKAEQLGYYAVTAPCGHEVWGTDSDIDSGIRKHLEYCPNYFHDDDDNTDDDESIPGAQDAGWRDYWATKPKFGDGE